MTAPDPAALLAAMEAAAQGNPTPEMVCAALDAWNNWKPGSALAMNIQPANGYTLEAWGRVVASVAMAAAPLCTLLREAQAREAQAVAAEREACADILAQGAIRLISNGRARVSMADQHTASVLRRYEAAIRARSATP